MIRYARTECVTFWRSREQFGGLSNMAGGYPITLGQHTIRTSEHLYQALRFPDLPDLQLAILALPNPISAKRLAQRQNRLTRADWEDIRIDVMRWCLELKFACNRRRFGDLLLSTGKHTTIVEASPTDNFWGATPLPNGDLRGWNMLGRLLWRLRRRIEIDLPLDLRSPVIDMINFRLVGDDALVLAHQRT
jgi:ribA/ribD-fused uncharacterized protein